MPQIPAGGASPSSLQNRRSWQRLYHVKYPSPRHKNPKDEVLVFQMYQYSLAVAAALDSRYRATLYTSPYRTIFYHFFPFSDSQISSSSAPYDLSQTIVFELFLWFQWNSILASPDWPSGAPENFPVGGTDTPVSPNSDYFVSKKNKVCLTYSYHQA